MEDAAALAELMRTLEDPGFFSRAAPELAALRPRPTDDIEIALDTLEREGWLSVTGAVSDAEAEALLSAIDAFEASNLPPLFVYMFDATWNVGARLAAALSRATRASYAVVPDAWAFKIAPGPEHAGWPPHRGTYELSIDRRVPDVVNVWVALTEVTVDSSCIHVVPLDRDPSYPTDLAAHAVGDGLAKPLPIPACAALAWNANVLHWGGPSTAGARGPRVSVTFTFERADRARMAHVDLARLGHRARLELVADQILTYGSRDTALAEIVRQWAVHTAGLRKAMGLGSRKAP